MNYYLFFLLTLVCSYTINYHNNIIYFSLDNYSVKSKILNGKEYTKYFVDNFIRTDFSGDPDIPVIRRAFIGNRLSFEIVRTKSKIIKTKRILPIPEYPNRCGESQLVFFFSEKYFINEFIPEKSISYFPFYQEKNHSGYILEIHPFQYNAVTNEIMITEELIIRLIEENPNIVYSKSRINLYKNLFMNLYGQISEEKETLLIIYADKHEKLINLLIEMKEKYYTVITSSLSQITLTSNTTEIKNFIRKLYLEQNLSNVILIGSVDDIPSYPNDNTGYSDANYGQMYDAPNVNVYISRISGNDNDIYRQVRKNAWYSNLKSIENRFYQGIASAESFGDMPTDCGFMKILHQMIEDDKKEETFYLECDPKANKSTIIENINTGLHYINYIGHGSGQKWVTSEFSIDDTFRLKNYFNNSIVIDVSCSNGDFTYHPCLAESMMFGAPEYAGVLAMYSSIPRAEWFPPVYMQYFAHYLIKNKDKELIATIGDMMYGGSIMACVLYPNGCRHLIDGYILYGDSSLFIVD